MPTLRPSPSGRALDYFTYPLAALALTTTLYVDQHTLVELADQNGSTIAPFATLRAALEYANAQSGVSWHLVMAFGDYSGEGTLSLLPGRRYVFDGVFRSSQVMRLPPMLWTVAGPATNYIQFRNVEAGLVTVLDGSPTSTTTVIVYENAACQGINAASSLATFTIIMSGGSLASFQTSSSTFVLGVVRANAVNINVGEIFAQNIQFDATCPLVRATNVLCDGCSFAQDMQVSGPSVELRESRWTGTRTLTFTGSAGTAFLDPHTQHSFDVGAVTLVNGSIIATDQTYDTSYAIPTPEGSTTGQSTFATTVTFAGSSYRLANYTSATHMYVQLTAVSAPTTLVMAIYQGPSGQTDSPLELKGVASLLVAAPGTFLVPFPSTIRLVPGVLFILYGKQNGGGNITMRTYTTPNQDLLNDPATVPSLAYPTAFTTSLGVSTSPPSTFNSTPSGGLVTAAGTSNLTAITRFATI